MQQPYPEWLSTVRSVPLTLDSYPVVCNSYMKLNQAMFLDSLSSDTTDKELLVVHPGTEQLLSCAIACAAFAGIFLSDMNALKHSQRFQVGEMVVRGLSRYRVEAVESTAYVLSSPGTGRNSDVKTIVPFSQAFDMYPYTGSALNPGRRGMRRSLVKALAHLQSIVGDTYHRQATAQPLSTLVVCSKEKADRIASSMALSDEYGTSRFIDMFPSAWTRSANEMVFYGGSVGKGDPTVIFTNSISMARELMYEDDDDRQSIHSVIIDGVSSPESQPEIDDIRGLLRRRNSGWMLLLQRDDDIAPLRALLATELTTVFWSQEVLLSTLDDLVRGPQNPLDQEIMNAIDRALDNTLERHVVHSPESFSLIHQCRTILKRLVRKPLRSTSLEEFLICAYGLINLFEQASFTMEEYEQCIKHGERALRSPKDQISRLRALSDEPLLQEYRKDTQSIALTLEEIYGDLSFQNPKKTELLRLLSDAHQAGVQYAVAVPRSSYVEPTSFACREYPQARILTVSTVSRQTPVERLIITSTPNYREDGLNPLASRAAIHRILLEYSEEKGKNDSYEQAIAAAMTPIQRAAEKSSYRLLGLQSEQVSLESSPTVVHLADNDDLDAEMTQLEIDSYTRNMTSRGSSQTTTLRTIRLAQFDTGEWAWLSQYYTAYVLEGDKLVEKSSHDLAVGDTVVFSSRGEEMTDFVDNILQELVQRQNAGALVEHYNMSKYWKQALRNYIETNRCTYEDISDAMRSLGHPRHAATIGSWLRDDSPIVGPRDSNAFLAIGLVITDADIANRAEQYKESCDFIRSQRIKILNYIQSCIIRSANRSGLRQEELLSTDEASFLGDVSRYAKELAIEQILHCERDLPGYLVNRPLGADRHGRNDSGTPQAT